MVTRYIDISSTEVKLFQMTPTTCRKKEHSFSRQQIHCCIMISIHKNKTWMWLCGWPTMY